MMFEVYLDGERIGWAEHCESTHYMTGDKIEFEFETTRIVRDRKIFYFSKEGTPRELVEYALAG